MLESTGILNIDYPVDSCSLLTYPMQKLVRESVAAVAILPPVLVERDFATVTTVACLLETVVMTMKMSAVSMIYSGTYEPTKGVK